MAFVKRSTPTDRLVGLIGPNWQVVLDHPLVARLIHSGVTAPLPRPDAGQFMQWVNMFDQTRWIATVPLDIKIFMYVVCLLLNKAGRPLPLSRNLFEQLHRHLMAASTLEKIDAMDGVSFAARQLMLWDIGVDCKHFHERYAVVTLNTTFKPKPKPVKAKPVFKVKPRPTRK